MNLQGINITLGLKFSGAIAVSGLDYYFGYSYIGSDGDTQSGTLLNNQEEMIVWEKSSYHTIETIEYFNLFNNDSATHIISVYLGANTIGSWELKTGERLEYINGRGWNVKDINGLEKINSVSVVPPECVCDETPIENLVKIINRNANSDFSKGHGTVRVGTKLFIATRNGILSKLVCYPDYNDLTTFVSIPLLGDCFAICYDSVENKIYAPIQYTKNIVVADANNILTYTTVAVAVTNNFVGGTILTDNTEFLYLGQETSALNIIKLKASDLSVNTEITWPHNIHGGGIVTSLGFAYFSSFANYLAKLDLSAMTIIDVALPFQPITDDPTFIPDVDTSGYGNLIVLASEDRNLSGNIGGMIVNADDMTTIYLVDLLPSFGVYYDDGTITGGVAKIINLCNEGFIETITVEKLILFIADYATLSSTYISDVFTFRPYFEPNELFITPDGYFVTNYNDGVTGGNLAKIELVKVDNTLMTKNEESYRSGSSSSSGGTSWTDVIVTDANFIAADDTRYYLASGVLTANRDVNMASITTKVMFVVSQDASEFYLNFTGATVYNRGGSDTITSVLGLWSSLIEKVDSKLIQTQ